MSYPGRSHHRRKRGEERHAVESVVTTNDEKSAEAIVGESSEGLNEIQFMSFTNCTKVSQNSLRGCLKGIKTGNLTSEGKE